MENNSTNRRSWRTVTENVSREKKRQNEMTVTMANLTTDERKRKSGLRPPAFELSGACFTVLSIRFAHQVLWWTLEGRKKRGQPKLNRHQEIAKEETGVGMLTADRSIWRVLTASCVGRIYIYI